MGRTRRLGRVLTVAGMSVGMAVAAAVPKNNLVAKDAAEGPSAKGAKAGNKKGKKKH